jgi:hypothetical protein
MLRVHQAVYKKHRAFDPKKREQKLLPMSNSESNCSQSKGVGENTSDTSFRCETKPLACDNAGGLVFYPMV